MSRPTYSVIVPMYNEEAVILESYRRLSEVMESMAEKYELIFVNDGSRDQTLAIMMDIMAKDNTVKVVNFARNFGHQIAVTAGMDYASGAAIVIIDADLQDPPEVIPKLAEKWRQGYHVVYGQRTKRTGDSIFKKITAWSYYRLLAIMTGNSIPLDTGDFRLMDRCVVEALKRMPEHSRFIRGMVSWVGFKQTPVMYSRDERWAGETKYPLKKMLKLAFDGITAFSVKPLKIATWLGSISTGLGLFYILVMLILVVFRVTVGSYHFTNTLILLVGGLIMICLGILGEYIGRIFEEAKGRPLYLIQHAYGLDKKEDLEDLEG